MCLYCNIKKIFFLIPLFFIKLLLTIFGTILESIKRLYNNHGIGATVTHILKLGLKMCTNEITIVDTSLESVGPIQVDGGTGVTLPQYRRRKIDFPEFGEVYKCFN